MENNSETTPKITVSKIASVAGVSPATVSRVINQSGIVKEETYNQVIEVMKTLGCSIPNKMIQGQSPSGGLIIINIPSLYNPFYSSIIKGVRTAISRHNYSLLIHEGFITPATIEPLIKTIKQSKVVGLITVTSIDTSLLKKLSALTCVVQCCDYNEEADLSYVSIDNTAISKYAVTHLIAQGKQRIAFINGPKQYLCTKYRLDGYIAALQDANIPLDPNFIVQLPEADIDLIVSISLQLLSLKNPPDAFFTASDMYGTAVLRACHLANKKIPHDVAVVGFDNLDTSKISIPSLTSVNQPSTQIGFMTGEILIEKLTNPASPNKKVLLEAELIVRESTLL